jgi:hypothetical protein
MSNIDGWMWAINTSFTRRDSPLVNYAILIGAEKDEQPRCHPSADATAGAIAQHPTPQYYQKEIIIDNVSSNHRELTEIQK